MNGYHNEFVISFEEDKIIIQAIQAIEQEKREKPYMGELFFIDELLKKYKPIDTEIKNISKTIYLKPESNDLHIYKGQSPDNGKAHPRKEIIGKEKDEILRVLKKYFEKGELIPKDDHYELVL